MSDAHPRKYDPIAVSAESTVVAEHVPGRLLVLFPGEYVNNTYRLLDARDGWGYQATAITADN